MYNSVYLIIMTSRDYDVESTAFDLSNDRTIDLLSAALAWGHYLYEVNHGLKNLSEDLVRYELDQGITFTEQKKFILISHNKGAVEFSDNDLGFKIEKATSLNKELSDDSGTFERPYQNSVFKYKIREDARQHYNYICLESPSCLLFLSRMRQFGKRIKITEAIERRFYRQFAQWLIYLIKSNDEFFDECEVLCLDSSTVEDFLQLENKRTPVEEDFELPLQFNYEGIGGVLAYQYFFNYLLYQFQTLNVRMDKWESREQVALVRKMLILAPKSGFLKDLLEKKPDDSKITKANGLKNFFVKLDLSDREFTNTLYKIQGQNGKSYYCLAEYASPIKQMYRMCNDHLAARNFDRKNLQKEIKNFADTLTFLLEHYGDDDCRYVRFCQVLYFDDRRDQSVADLVIREVEKM